MRRSLLLALLVGLVVGWSAPVQAARTGGGTTSDYLSTTTVPTVRTVTMWVNVASLAATQTVFCESVASGTGGRFIRVLTSGAVEAATETNGALTSVADTANTLTTGGWHFVYVDFANNGTSGRAVSLDGGTLVSEGTNRGPPTADTITFLMENQLVDANPSSATIRDVAIFNNVATSAARTNLIKTAYMGGLGRDPRTCCCYAAGDSLVAYWPLGGNSSLIDVIGHNTLTLNGTVNVLDTHGVPLGAGGQ